VSFPCRFGLTGCGLDEANLLSAAGALYNALEALGQFLLGSPLTFLTNGHPAFSLGRQGILLSLKPKLLHRPGNRSLFLWHVQVAGSKFPILPDSRRVQAPDGKYDAFVQILRSRGPAGRFLRRRVPFLPFSPVRPNADT
jgi:hypothetical protein